MCKIFILWSEISLGRWLLYGDIFAGAVAGVGIIWETMKGGESFERIAQRCVIWGVVAETLFSVCLFFVEDAASREASGKASVAIERSAILEKDAAELRERAAADELALAKLKLPRSLSPDAIKRIAERLKPFAGTAFDLSVAPGAEGIFLDQMRQVLDFANWEHWRFGGVGRPRNELLVIDGMDHAGLVGLFTGVRVVYATSNPSLEAPAEALAKALTDEGFEAIAEAKAGLETGPAPMRADIIHVQIGNRT